MKIVYLLFTLFILIFVSTGCRKNNGTVTYKSINGNKVLACDIDKIQETKKLKLSELVESSQMIRLSNRKEALLGPTWLEEFSSKHIFLADMKNKLYLFDLNGQLLKSWNPGKGSTEFILPGYPQFLNNKVFVQDKLREKLLKYDLLSNEFSDVDIQKPDSKSVVLSENKILSIGNSQSENDPFLVCMQDFNGKIIQSVKSRQHVLLNPPLVSEMVISYPVQGGLNIHFPANDTLKFYDVNKNTLEHEAIFYSLSHVETNKQLLKLREKNALNISDKKLTNTVTVVPEFETGRYYFLSVYNFGEDEQLPWYVAKRKLCLVDKIEETAFYVELVNDFWGDIPFRPSGNSRFWSDEIVQCLPAMRVKSMFSEVVKEATVPEKMLMKLQQVISETNDEDNNIVFYYKLK